MKLYWPLLSNSISQGFGANFIQDGKPFYGGFVPGIIGHNGIDLAAASGTSVYACHDGVVKSFSQADGFIVLRYEAPGGATGVETVYGHCDSLSVPIGSQVKAGSLLAISDNRGPYTTGPHLHLHVYELGMVNGTLQRLHLDNGYRGAVDPMKYLVPWGVLAKAFGSSQVYQLVGNTKRPIADKLALFSIGASGYDPVIEVESSQLNSFPDGRPVTYAYGELKLTPEQLKDLMRTFTENPAGAQEIYGGYFG